MRNPTMGVNVALGRFTVGSTSFSFINHAAVREQRQLNRQSQLNASALWSTTETGRAMPIVNFTIQESSELAGIMADVETFVREWTLQFLLGRRDINAEFDAFTRTLRQMRIERAIEIQQNALNRWLRR
jgi:putative aldouronate transport system substrate-binding protein